MSAGKNAKVVPVNGIFRPNRARIVVGHVDPAIGEPDVVDLFCRDNFADGVLDEITKTGRLLNTGACRGTDVHKNLARINGREEVLAEERRKSEGNEHAAEKADNDGFGPAEGEREQRPVAVTDPCEVVLKALLEPLERIART